MIFLVFYESVTNPRTDQWTDGPKDGQTLSLRCVGASNKLSLLLMSFTLSKQTILVLFYESVTNQPTDRRTDGRTGGRTDPPIEMRGLIQKCVIVEF